MNIQVGRKYCTRGGETVEAMKLSQPAREFKYAQVRYGGVDERGYRYWVRADTGAYLSSGEHGNDVIQECAEQ